MVRPRAGRLTVVWWCVCLLVASVGGAVGPAAGVAGAPTAAGPAPGGDTPPTGRSVDVASVGLTAAAPAGPLNRTYGESGADRLFDVIAHPAGGYVAAGWRTSPDGDTDLWVLRVADNGSVRWNRTYGGAAADAGYGIARAAGNATGYVVVGRTASIGAGGEDLWVLRVADNGSARWNRTLGGAADDRGWAVTATDAGIGVAGQTESFGPGGDDAWLVVLNRTGTPVVNRTYGTDDIDVAFDVHPRDGGGYVLTGIRSFDAWLAAVTADGERVWSRTYGGSGIDVGSSVRPAHGGGYVIGGITDVFDQSTTGNAWLLRVNATGAKRWERTYGGPARDAASAVRRTETGYVLAGSTVSFAASGGDDRDAWVIQTAPNGSVRRTVVTGGPADDAAFGLVAPTPAGITFVGDTAADGWLRRVPAADLAAGTTTATPNASVTVPISAASAVGIAGYTLNVTFDPAVVTGVTVAGTASFPAPNVTVANASGWVRIAADRPNAAARPRLVTLRFRLGPAANVSTAVAFESASTTLRTADGTPITRSLRSGRITVRAITPGDVTGDGRVDTGDVIQIQRFIVNLRSFSSRQATAADVTGDGLIDTGDVIRIQRRIVGLST